MKKYTVMMSAFVLAMLLLFTATLNACRKRRQNDVCCDVETVVIGDDYDANVVKDRLNELRQNGGFYIRQHYDTNYGAADNLTYDIVCAACGDTYYYRYTSLVSIEDEDSPSGYSLQPKEKQIYLDHGDTALTVYTMEDGVWHKHIRPYGASFTRESAKSEVDQYSGVSDVLRGYSGFKRIHRSMQVEKTDEIVAGRACDRYVATMTDNENISIEICIDRETSVMTRFCVTGATLSFFGYLSSQTKRVECEAFTVPYTITLPDVDAEHTTVDE